MDCILDIIKELLLIYCHVFKKVIICYRYY